MNIQELETMKRLNLNIKLFILNNQGYVSVRATQKNFFKSFFVGSTIESGLTLPDYVKVAEAHGIKAVRLSDHTELEEKLDEVINYQGPVLCELMVDPELVTQPRISNFQKEDGSFVSKPLEDLWPFLDREEFKKNMIIKPINE
jgi:acetolactate synthase I/II/III large subunit